MIIVSAFILAAAAIGSSILAKKSKMIGELAPDFTLQSDTGSRISLRDYRGNIVILHYGPTW